MAKDKEKLTEAGARDKAQRLTEVEAQIRKNEAKMNAELNEIQQKYAERTAELNKEKGDLTKELVNYAKKNPNHFPEGKKSFEWGAVKFSFRTTTPKVNIANGMTWEDAVEKMEAAGLVGYVRHTREVAKDSILLAVDLPEEGDELRGKLAKIGITVTQSEKWEVEVKEQEL